MARELQYRVDQLLAEHGEYVPLEFLLQEGRLSYLDYEAWRNGELESLDDHLFGDPELVHQQLAEAERYLQARGWQAEPLHYEPWRASRSSAAPESTGRPLRFSADAAVNASFHRRYRKPQHHPQLDLFTDNPVTTVVNGILQSLSDLRPSEARRLLERLHELAPDHTRLGELERLTEATEDLDAPVADVGAELDRLQETLVPLADSLLGPAARHLLVPLWRRLSQAVRDHPYQAAAPEMHLSHTAAQALDWAAAQAAVEREPGWQGEPVLLLRHARACEQQRDFAAALPSWFALCWRFPEQAEALAVSANHELRERWETFQDLEPALPVSSVPAWLLLNRPGLCRVLRDPTAEALPYPDSYLTLYRLRCEQALASAPSSPEAIALRARLKQQDPELFEHFLRALPT